jgi:DNA-binding GntR family transcriptional regulator
MAGSEFTEDTRALSPISRARTATEEVEQRLIMAIARGDKAPGERITESELASALNVSRVPAREAMQKLQLRGILVAGSDQRGLRVLDYSDQRIAELFELRLAIEKLIFRHVMQSPEILAALVPDLNRIVGKMNELSTSADPVVLSSVDLEFHRYIAQHSGNKLAAQIWEGLAQHMLIVFCRHWSSASNRAGEVELHKELVRFIQSGAVGDVERVLKDHFLQPDSRTPTT